jgi:excisionase family DNA binding protein
MEAVYNVRQASQILGVSAMQVGRLIAQGDLDASRFGRSWAIAEDSVHRYSTSRPPKGRPLSTESAWYVLRFARPQSLVEASLLAVRCRRRSTTLNVRVVPGLLNGALTDSRVVVSGADAGLAHHAAITVGAQHVVYVRRSEVAPFLADHRASSGAASPNLMVRIVDDASWPFSDERIVPAHVAAIDLIDIGDERSAVEVLAAAE